MDLVQDMYSNTYKAENRKKGSINIIDQIVPTDPPNMSQILRSYKKPNARPVPLEYSLFRIFFFLLYNLSLRNATMPQTFLPSSPVVKQERFGSESVRRKEFKHAIALSPSILLSSRKMYPHLPEHKDPWH